VPRRVECSGGAPHWRNFALALARPPFIACWSTMGVETTPREPVSSKAPHSEKRWSEKTSFWTATAIPGSRYQGVIELTMIAVSQQHASFRRKRTCVAKMGCAVAFLLNAAAHFFPASTGTVSATGDFGLASLRCTFIMKEPRCIVFCANARQKGLLGSGGGSAPDDVKSGVAALVNAPRGHPAWALPPRPERHTGGPDRSVDTSRPAPGAYAPPTGRDAG
jgi:hypothetical protein